MPVLPPQHNRDSAFVHVQETIHGTDRLLCESRWLTIASCTLMLRLSTFPVVIKQMQNTAKMTKMRPEMEALNEEAKARVSD